MVTISACSSYILSIVCMHDTIRRAESAGLAKRIHAYDSFEQMNNVLHAGLSDLICHAENAVFYGQNAVPFVMGTTGGDREKLIKDTQDLGTYAVIAPQMGKQVDSKLLS